MNGRRLYVVTAIDTEGPIDDPRKPEILSNWDRVRGLVDKLFSEEYRLASLDNEGKGAIFSWYILTLTGFSSNPFNRPMRYHEVHDQYCNGYGAGMKRWGDGVYWHQHQPAPSGIGNEWCRDWTHNQEYDVILARLAIERDFFPSSYRAGGRIQTNDSSWWLEQIIPFDYSSCSGNVNWDRRESDGQRLGDICDWSRAPADWSPYHPDEDDYQRPGRQRRWMFRCPDLDSPVHSLSDEDIRQAFRRADRGEPTVLSFFEHDRRDNMAPKIADAWARIARIGREEFPAVTWTYANARDAAVASLGLAEVPAPAFTVTVRPDRRLDIATAGRLFGTQPFVAVSDRDGSAVCRLPILTIGRNRWLTDPLDARWFRGAIAANSPTGQAGVTHFEVG